MMTSERLDKPGEVRSGEELEADRLAAYLGEHLPGLATPFEIQQFPRGRSNLTYLLRAGSRELVLRRPPLGADIRSAHDMGREYRILSQLSRHWARAPRPLLFCDDPEVIGAQFYVMERVPGIILRPKMPAALHPRPERMAVIATGFVETFAELHAIDYEAAGLRELGRPDGYVRRQVDGWIGRYENARTDDVPEMTTVAAWLDAWAPAESGASLIHNDFKYDNLVLDPEDGARVIAVLDWEMATLGDPLMDLGTSLGYWVEPQDPPGLRQLSLGPTLLPGNPTRTELVERYAAASGREIGDPLFYYVYGLFKIAVIVQQIYARYHRGYTQDLRFAQFNEGVRACALVASRAVELRRIDRLF
jgi:aminoglycoside phosphotransferase (APT) family kinase protein